MITIQREHKIHSFKQGMEPVARVADGSLVLFHCNDCFTQQVQTEADVVTQLKPETLNPATGPVYVEGAEPGDLLRVDIIDIQLADQGAVAIIQGAGFLGDQCKTSQVKILPVKEGFVHFNDLRIPVDPMIGVIGVAPKTAEEDWETATPWKHGGNMDTTAIRPGTSLYFPVGEPGAMLALGDCHALMGDGEVCIAGLEIPADVTLRVSVVKGADSTWPILVAPDASYVIASGKTLEEASRQAMSQAVDILARSLDLPWEEAYMLASLQVNAQISQLVNAMVTVRAQIPQSLVSSQQLLASLRRS